MVMRHILRQILRAAIVVSLIAGGLTPVAMATPKASHCGLMAMDGPMPTAADGDMDARAPCAFAAYCAVAGCYVAPAPVSEIAVGYQVDLAFSTGDDPFRLAFQPSPPARPPRS